MTNVLTNLPDYLADRTKTCGNGHTTLHPTPEKAAKVKCPFCNRNRSKETPPRQLDPEPWATGYGAERARASRARGIEKSARQRRSA